jgi:hypothetical protein
MKVSVTTLDNKKLEMGESFNNTNQITHLKMQISDRIGIDPELFILTYDDNKLNNNKLLSNIDQSKANSIDLKMVLKFDLKNNGIVNEKVNDKFKGMLSTNKAVEFLTTYLIYRYSPLSGVNELIKAGKIRKDQANNIRLKLRGIYKKSNSSVSSSSNISSNEEDKMRNNQMTQNMEQLSNKMRNNKMTQNMEQLSNKMKNNQMKRNKMRNNQMTQNMEQLSNKMRNNQMKRNKMRNNQMRINLEELSNKMKKNKNK